MAADRPEGSNLEQSIAKRMGNRLRRMFGLENLHDGNREQFEEAHESIPEGGRPLDAETMPGRAGTSSSLPDAGLSRPWSSDFEPFPTPGAGGDQSEGISGGGTIGSSGTGLEAAGLAGGATGNSGAAHTAPSGGSGPGHASASGGGTGGAGGNSGAHTGPHGGRMSPVSSSSTGFKGETHRPITDKDEQVTGDEDKPVRGTVIENPISSEGKLLVLKSFTIEGFPTTHTPGSQPVTIPGIGSFLVDQLGNYTFTPAPDWNGQVPTIHYTVTDGYSTNNSTLNINIKPIDDSFTDNSEKFIYDEDSGKHSGDLLKGSSSPDGPLSIVSFSVDGQSGTLGQPLDIPGKGTLTIYSNGTFEFESAPNYNGPIPQATYTVTDGSGKDVQSTLNINVKPVDDSFTDNSEKFIYDEDSGKHSGDLLKGSSSPDGPLSIVSFSVDGQSGTLGQPLDIPGKGTLTIYSNGTFEFESAPNYNGPIPQATYTVTDGSGKDVQSTLNINITGTNDAPVLSAAGSIDQSEDQLEAGIQITAAQSNLLTNASDIDNQNSSLSIASINGQTANVGQPVTVTLHYTDADGHQQTQDVNLTVNADGSYSISQFDLDALPDGAKATATFSYTVKDPGGLTSQTQTANINITGTNDAPVANDDINAFTVNQNKTSSPLNLLSNDTDIDNSSLTITSINNTPIHQGTTQSITVANGTVVIDANGSVTFTPNQNYNGPISFSYTISDGHGGTDSAQVTGAVTPDPTPIFSDASEHYSMKLGDPDLRRNLLDNTSIQQHGGQNIAVSISDFNIEGQKYQPGETAHLSSGELTVNRDGSLIFTPAQGFSGSVPQVTYHLTDGIHPSQTSTADIQVDSYRLLDADEWISGKEGQAIAGELTAGTHRDNGSTPHHLEITQVLDPTGKSLNRDPLSGHFIGKIHDENNAIAGQLDVDPATGHYIFTPSPNWTGNIGTSNLPPISYLIRDENGVQDGSVLGIKIDPSWTTPPITGQTVINPGTNAGAVQVGSGAPGAYYLAKEGQAFDPGNPHSIVHGDIGDLSVDNHGQVSFTYDAQRGQSWAEHHRNLVHTQTIDVDTGAKTGSTSGKIINPGGRAAGVPGFSHGNAWWKHPITGEMIQRPPEQSSGTLGFAERWVVYNAKGEVVGHYYVTADLQLTETVTHTYSSYWHHGGGPPYLVYKEIGTGTTTSNAIITHILAGSEAPTSQERAQNSGTANDTPDGSASGSDDQMEAYADYCAAIALLSEDTQDALKELHLHSVKLVTDEDLKETIKAVTDQGELHLHISDGLQLDTTSLDKDFLLIHPSLNTATSSTSQGEETNSQNANTNPNSESAVAGNAENSLPHESGNDEQQESPSQSSTGIEAAHLAAALNKIKDNIQADKDGSKSGTGTEGIHDNQEPTETHGTTNPDNASDQTAAANIGIAAESSQTDGSLLQRLVQKVQSTIAGTTEESANPEVQDVATSTMVDPFSEPKQVQPPDDLASSEPSEDYQPLLEPQDNQDHLMQ